MLTLWVAAVAEREGHSWDEALSFGHAIAGRFAQSKGRSIGVFEEAPEETPERAARRERNRAGTQPVEVFGTRMLARSDDQGRLLAAEGAGVVNPAAVREYLHRAFGARLDDATAALRRLAAALPVEKLRSRGVAYDIYTRIRPGVPPGAAGWGRKGHFDLHACDMIAEEALLDEQPEKQAAAEHKASPRKRARA